MSQTTLGAEIPSVRWVPVTTHVTNHVPKPPVSADPIRSLASSWTGISKEKLECQGRRKDIFLSAQDSLLPHGEDTSSLTLQCAYTALRPSNCWLPLTTSHVSHSLGFTSLQSLFLATVSLPNPPEGYSIRETVPHLLACGLLPSSPPIVQVSLVSLLQPHPEFLHLWV